jgi:hypothetical protein
MRGGLDIAALHFFNQSGQHGDDQADAEDVEEEGDEYENDGGLWAGHALA